MFTPIAFDTSEHELSRDQDFTR